MARGGAKIVSRRGTRHAEENAIVAVACMIHSLYYPEEERSNVITSVRRCHKRSRKRKVLYFIMPLTGTQPGYSESIPDHKWLFLGVKRSLPINLAENGRCFALFLDTVNRV